MPNSFDVNLERGKQGEKVVREWLMKTGHYVIPASLIETGGAPALIGHLKKIVIPDILASKNGETMWVEVKTKGRATYNKNRRRWEHGVNLGHWQAYLEAQQVTGMKGHLAILQVDRCLIMKGALDVIAKAGVEYHGSNMNDGKPHIFFDVQRFEWFSASDFAPLMPDMDEPRVIRPWEHIPQPVVRQLNLW